MRSRGRTDLNQTDIVDALRKAGATVAITSDLGHGFPDLVTAFRGRWRLMEVKQPGEGLTPDEAKWHASHDAMVHIVHSEEEALKAIGAI